MLEIAKSGSNLVSDRKVDFSRNLACALAEFYGHYSSRDLHMLKAANAKETEALLRRRKRAKRTDDEVEREKVRRKAAKAQMYNNATGIEITYIQWHPRPGLLSLEGAWPGFAPLH